MKIKSIKQTTIAGATPLTPREMNRLRFSVRHTVLTPGRLKEDEKERDAASSVGAPAVDIARQSVEITTETGAVAEQTVKPTEITAD